MASCYWKAAGGEVKVVSWHFLAPVAGQRLQKKSRSVRTAPKTAWAYAEKNGRRVYQDGEEREEEREEYVHGHFCDLVLLVFVHIVDVLLLVMANA